jgi:hypothetical protein
MKLLIEELPGIRPVESTNFDGCDKFGIEIAEVYAVPGSPSWRQRFPVRDAPTGSTVNGAQSLVSPNVLRGGLWVAFDFDRPELEVDPRPAYATAQGAVAASGDFGRRRQSHANCAAVA